MMSKNRYFNAILNRTSSGMTKNMNRETALETKDGPRKGTGTVLLWVYADSKPWADRVKHAMARCQVDGKP
jgi:hypothetical protein